MDSLFRKILDKTTPKILAVGKNYVAHVKEMGGEKPPAEPLIFMKPFSSIYKTFENQPF